eukprot:TRINITY_DN95921_c1_g1_i3.p2 TRINITY_DN95921_c1_g1~~TRINITY_DN95921_c1_g1_i3.p2  ORF type:complete len:150 (-),score=2.93 TRINITY_DN95921_c1_g1_i3:209-658(-)
MSDNNVKFFILNNFFRLFFKQQIPIDITTKVHCFYNNKEKYSKLAKIIVLKLYNTITVGEIMVLNSIKICILCYIIQKYYLLLNSIKIRMVTYIFKSIIIVLYLNFIRNWGEKQSIQILLEIGCNVLKNNQKKGIVQSQFKKFYRLQNK